MADKKNLTILVSSTVYGFEELLERIFTILTQSGYEVWMSHKGTVPVNPNLSSFENCLEATNNCDLFLGLITPYYGSGKNNNNDLSITHQELKRAIELNKPRWLLVHDHVVFARALLKYLGYKGKIERKNLFLRDNQVLDDLRVIDMYEDAALLISDDQLEDRQGNWVQKFYSENDASLFTVSQFSRYQDVEKFIEENLQNKNRVLKTITKKEDVHDLGSN